jgi:hypothetical protein
MKLIIDGFKFYAKNITYLTNHENKIKLANTYLDHYYEYHFVNWGKLWTLYSKWMFIKGQMKNAF